MRSILPRIHAGSSPAPLSSRAHPSRPMEAVDVAPMRTELPLPVAAVEPSSAAETVWERPLEEAAFTDYETPSSDWEERSVVESDAPIK